MKPHNVFICESEPETLHFMVKSSRKYFQNIVIMDSNSETLQFRVESSSRNEFHDVYVNRDNGMVCTCEHYYYRKQACKHMIQVKEFMEEMNNIVQNSVTCEEVWAHG